MTDTTDPRRKSIQELKWLKNSFSGLLALADALQEPLEIQRDVDALKAELVDLKSQRACYTDLQANIASAKSELAKITAEIDTVRAKFRAA